MAAALASVAAGCARVDHPVAGAREQPYDVVTIASYTASGPGTTQRRRLPASAYRARWFFQDGLAPAVPPRPFPKVDPQLSLRITAVPPDEKLRVFVSFRDTVTMPRLPRVDVHQPRTAAVNLAVLDTVTQIINDVRARRDAAYQADTVALSAIPGVVIRDHFWLVQGVVADIPAGNIDAWAASPNVIHVRLNQGSPPPDHDTPDNDVIRASGQIRSSVLYAQGYRYGWTALLDTGVRSTHRLLHGPSPLCRVVDCVTDDCSVTGDLNCNEFQPDGSTPGGVDIHPYGHGTSSAAILAGNDQPMGATTSSNVRPFRGITQAVLDCFGVYDSQRLLDVGATVHAFELAIARLNRVIVAEIAETSLPDITDVGLAADRAYAAGACVIAANGNSNLPSSGVPASGHRVLGVGAYNVVGEAEVVEAFGTADRRPKPELLAPTYTETAGNASDTALEGYGGTSGATPYAAGAAVMLRDWMSGGGWDVVDPGQVYAHLVLSGDRVGPFDEVSKFGAGRLKLPAAGRSWYGKVALSSGVRLVEIPIDVTDPNIVRIAAALWWPEATTVVSAGAVSQPNDVDLEILQPGWGGAVAISASRVGTFERASWSSASPLSGTWRVRIVSRTLRTEPLDVYWAVALQP